LAARKGVKMTVTSESKANFERMVIFVYCPLSVGFACRLKNEEEKDAPVQVRTNPAAKVRRDCNPVESQHVKPTLYWIVTGGCKRKGAGTRYRNFNPIC
jgi:hypothetical protein